MAVINKNHMEEDEGDDDQDKRLRLVTSNRSRLRKLLCVLFWYLWFIIHTWLPFHFRCDPQSTKLYYYRKICNHYFTFAKSRYGFWWWLINDHIHWNLNPSTTKVFFLQKCMILIFKHDLVALSCFKQFLRII